MDVLKGIWHRARPALDVLGAIATLFVIYQAISYFFIEGRSITAAYQVRSMAQEGKIFDLRKVILPDLAEAKNVVEISVLIWNSGSESIEKKDVRREVGINLIKSSKVLGMLQGLQRSNKVDDFHFEDITPTSYRLIWDVLDPGDYFEAHFLLASNLDKTSLQKPIGIDGLIAGNIRVRVQSLNDIGLTRNAVIALSAFVVLGALLLLTPLLVSRSEILKRAFNSTSVKVAVPTLMTYLVVAFAVAVIVGSLIGNYFVRVPAWLEPVYFPPHLYVPYR